MNNVSLLTLFNPDLDIEIILRTKIMDEIKDEVSATQAENL